MTDEAFVTGMAMLGELYPKTLSPMAVNMYRQVCGHMSDSVWEASIGRVVARNTFFPVPAELVAAARDVAAESSGIMAPSDAWSHVHQVARGWCDGALVKHKFDGPTWDALRSIGGIRVVALAEDGAEIARMQRQFITAYTRIFEQAAEIAVTLPLASADTLEALPAGGVR